MRSRATSSMLRMTFFSILTSCDSFRARSGPKAPAAFFRNACPNREIDQRPLSQEWFSSATVEFATRSSQGGERPEPIRQSRIVPSTDSTRANATRRSPGATLTQAALSEPSVGLGCGQWGRGVLDLRGGRDARLAHRIGAMHGGIFRFVEKRRVRGGKRVRGDTRKEKIPGIR